MRRIAMVVWFLVSLFVVGGVAVMLAAESSAGLYLIIIGLFLAVLQILDIRRVTKARQDICPRCGQMIVRNSKLCTNCGFEIE